MSLNVTIRKNVYIYGTGLTAKHCYELISAHSDYLFQGFLNRNFCNYSGR